MSWIEEVDHEASTGELRAVYDELVSKRGKLSNIMKVQSLNPGAMQHHLDLYMHLMFGQSNLSRPEREAIAVVVSAANNCAYCVSHHAEALARYEKDESRINELIKGLRFREGTDRRSRMLAYAAKLTSSPGEIRESDIATLREAGLSDREILDVNLIVAYFNFVNRIALGLGVQFSADEVQGYELE